MRLKNKLAIITAAASGMGKAGVELFVRELPQRLAAMHSALGADNLEQLRTLAHQLKGAAGGYGFPKLGEAAALVDQGVKDGCEPNVIRGRVGMLAALAARIRP